MRCVTIYRIYDETFHPKDLKSYMGCLDGDPTSYELPDGAFVESIREGLKQEIIEPVPGFYLMLEFNEDIDEYQGIVFTIYPDGQVMGGCVIPAPVPRLTSWPPK